MAGKRAVPVVLVTAGGIALLASFKTTPGLPTLSAIATTTTENAPATIVPSSTTTTTTTTRPVTRTTTRPTIAATVPPTTAPVRRTINGPVETNRYGDVQVQVTFTGHHLDDVDAIQMPQDRQRSAEISSEAGPQLRQEALQAQSADIASVSGASYTSESYKQSLQGAIDANR